MKSKRILFFFVYLSASNCFSQWVKKEDFPGSSRNFAVSFSIHNKGYYGLGQKRIELFVYKVYNDFWEYDAENNSWTQKADFAGGGRLGAKGFSVQGKGYAGFGYFIAATGPNAGGNSYQPDFYEFIPDSNKWFKKNDSYLADRDMCFVINDTVWTVNPEYRVVKRYDPSTDQWIESKWEKKTLAPDYSDITGSDIAFSLNGKAYVMAVVRKKRICTNQLWEFNPRTLVWVKKNDLPPTGNDTLSVFYGGEKQYLFRGKNNLLEYNPSLDSWIEKNGFLPPLKYLFPAFSLQGKSYFIYQHEVWAFTP